ncbi:hypothetical protein [Streptomyces microflavus]|uniref:hypothetical protein n=1 Tax=Streptomyces microflavus TaxID=1919 RepID=UPI003B22112D
MAKKGSSKRYSAAESQQIEAVRACFPPEVREGLPRARHLADKILAAMAEGRTVEQMRDRIWFRWANHGWADKHDAGELNPKRMVGPPLPWFVRCGVETGSRARTCGARTASA